MPEQRVMKHATTLKRESGDTGNATTLSDALTPAIYVQYAMIAAGTLGRPITSVSASLTPSESLLTVWSSGEARLCDVMGGHATTVMMFPAPDGTGSAEAERSYDFPAVRRSSPAMAAAAASVSDGHRPTSASPKPQSAAGVIAPLPHAEHGGARASRPVFDASRYTDPSGTVNTKTATGADVVVNASFTQQQQQHEMVTSSDTYTRWIRYRDRHKQQQQEQQQLIDDDQQQGSQRPAGRPDHATSDEAQQPRLTVPVPTPYPQPATSQTHATQRHGSSAVNSSSTVTSRVTAQSSAVRHTAVSSSSDPLAAGNDQAHTSFAHDGYKQAHVDDDDHDHHDDDDEKVEDGDGDEVMRRVVPQPMPHPAEDRSASSVMPAQSRFRHTQQRIESNAVMHQ